jgi:hypothetical protein
MKIESYPLQTAIELACAAYRANNGYLSERQLMEKYNPDETRYTNKELMLVAMGAIDPKKYEDVPNKPVLLCTNLDDKELAGQMTKFFRRLMFAAIEGEDQFKVDLFGILNQEEVPINKLGFVACLPQTYIRDKYELTIKQVDQGHLADIGTELLDKDCEIIKVSRSKNYDAFNVDAIIDNKLVFFQTKKENQVGPCVILSAKVKNHFTHWKHTTVPVTALNYVKIFQ